VFCSSYCDLACCDAVQFFRNAELKLHTHLWIPLILPHSSSLLFLYLSLSLSLSYLLLCMCVCVCRKQRFLKHLPVASGWFTLCTQSHCYWRDEN